MSIESCTPPRWRARAGGALAALVLLAPAGVAPAAAGQPPRIEVEAALAPGLADRVRPDDVVYVFARAWEGAALPLATLRARAGDLPATWVLDDSASVMSGQRLSDHRRVEVVVRVSKSGDAARRAGDLEGSAGPVAVGPEARARVVVDRVVEGEAAPAGHAALGPAPADAAPAHPTVHRAGKVDLAPEVRARWGSVTLSVAGREGALRVDVGGGASLGGGAKVEVLEFVPAFTTDEGVVSTASNDPDNPAALVRVTDADGTTTEGWLFQRFPGFNTFRHASLDLRLVGGHER